MYKKICIILIILLFSNLFCLSSYGTNIYTFEGEGSKENPFRISTKEDMIKFSEAVNSGNSYENVFFVLTNDIDMAEEEMIPIGVYESNNYFFGTFDGNGHVLYNLNICANGNSALFGQLGGVVENLGIESGNIISEGCNGAIASHSASSDALIINCFNKASVSGYRAGGIADNFGGRIINCWSDCELNGSETGGIISYGAYEVICCFSSNSLFHDEQTNSIKSFQVKTMELYSDNMAQILNENIYTNTYNRVKPTDLNIWVYNKQTGDLRLCESKSPMNFKVLLLEIRDSFFVFIPWIILGIIIVVMTMYVYKKSN